MYQLISERLRRSYKHRQCDWCGENIGIGETYISSASRFEENFQFHKFHPECYGVMKDEARHEGEEIDFDRYANPRPGKEEE